MDESKDLLKAIREKKKLKKISYNKIAKNLGYATHASVTYWVRTRKIPMHVQSALKKLLRRCK